jgi:hypothetical protein
MALHNLEPYLPMSASPLFEYFDQVSVINLPDRLDRRRQIEAEFRRLGAYPAADRVCFFPAIRPEQRGGWPSAGARGNFLSHYNILRSAHERKLRSVLIMEDDCSFTSTMHRMQGQVAQALSATDWDIVYLGHVEVVQGDKPFELVEWPRPLLTSHMYAVNRPCMDRLVNFLEVVTHRPAGHPDGGPQCYDGALCTFRAQNPDVKTLISVPSLACQRSSRSDISPGLLDTFPATRAVVGIARRLKNLIGRQ